MGAFFTLAVFALVLVGMWKAFVKAGQPGWAGIIPIYNIIVLVRMANKPMWWVIMFFIPIAQIIFPILLGIEIAKMFGKGGGFGVGLAFLPFIFWPILGFGDAKYLGAPAAAAAAVPPVQP